MRTIGEIVRLQSFGVFIKCRKCGEIHFKIIQHKEDYGYECFECYEVYDKDELF